MFTKRYRPPVWAVLAILALGLTALLAATPAARAAPAAPAYVTGYHYSQGYSYNPVYGSSMFVSLHTTNSFYQVWINGSVHCAGYNGAHVYQCGIYRGSNGTDTLVVGGNYSVNGQNFWYRLDLKAPVLIQGCGTEGNAGVRAVTYCFAAP